MRLKIFSYNIFGLPFLPDTVSNHLATWFTDTDYDLIFLQEVFTVGRIKILTESLEKNGYTVIKPNDLALRTNILSSGLLSAFKKSRWNLLQEGFQFYEQSTLIENFANKGFHWLKLIQKNNLDPIMVINTHMQADNSVNFLTGYTDTKPIRRSQAEQILKQIEKTKLKHLIIGDINSENEPHDEFLYLTGKKNGIQKHTFIETGEDLDHVAYIPKFMQKAIPIVKEISVLSNLWWSDHWPIDVIVEL